MSVLIKRSATAHVPAECGYGCCTTIYGKNTRKVRRSIKRAERRDWKKEQGV